MTNIIKLIISLLILLLSPSSSRADLPAGWQHREFAGQSQYTVEHYQGQTVIKGRAAGTASMLFKPQRINLKQTPYVNWRWKVANTYGEFDEKTKAGDDYPARFYVVLQHGPLPWQTLALNYVWSSSYAVGQHWPNAYTSNAMVVVLKSGEQGLGQWHSEKRNVVADFKRLFNVEVSHLDGYAIMVDGDNTGSQGVAWFSEIRFSPN